MNIPKVKFETMSLEENIEIIKWAFYEDNGDLSIHDYTIQYFKDLAKVDINCPKEDVYKLIEQVVTKDYHLHEDEIKREVERYNRLWEPYNDKYFEILSNYLGVTFPHNIKQINATVGLIPVFPRYLEDFSFSLSTRVEDWKVIEVTAHETLHFLWFEKWKQIHPETPEIKYNSPYIEWRYSEMVTDPILNNKPFNEVFNFNEKGYDSFYELYDNGELVMDKLRNIYSSNMDINKKIDDGFEYVSNVLNQNKNCR